jgi:hypothetical protein
LSDAQNRTGKLVVFRLQVEQSEEAGELSQQSLQLVERYNTILASLSQAFILADSQISAAEQRAARPPSAE